MKRLPAVSGSFNHIYAQIPPFNVIHKTFAGSLFIVNNKKSDHQGNTSGQDLDLFILSRLVRRLANDIGEQCKILLEIIALFSITGCSNDL
jgi:hypothetical protein